MILSVLWVFASWSSPMHTRTSMSQDVGCTVPAGSYHELYAYNWIPFHSLHVRKICFLFLTMTCMQSSLPLETILYPAGSMIPKSKQNLSSNWYKNVHIGISYADKYLNIEDTSWLQQ